MHHTRIIALIRRRRVVAALRERYAAARAAGWVVSGASAILDLDAEDEDYRVDDGEADSDGEETTSPPVRYEPLWPSSGLWGPEAKGCGVWPDEPTRRALEVGGGVDREVEGNVFRMGLTALYDESDVFVPSLDVEE